QSNNVLQKLKQNRIKLSQVVEKIDELEKDSNQLNRLKEEQKIFQEKGLLNKFKEFDKYQIENNRIINRSDNDLEKLTEIVDNLKAELDVDTQYLSNESIKELINRDIFSSLESEWKNLINEFKKQTKLIDISLSKSSRNISKLSKDWEKRFVDFQKQFDLSIRTLPEIGGLKGSELAKRYDSISKKIASIEGATKKLDQERKLRDQLNKERMSLLSELDDILLDDFKSIDKECKRLSKGELFSKLLIECDRGTERILLKEFLLGISGIGEKKIEWIDKASELTIRQLVKDIRSGKDVLLENYKNYGLTQTSADILGSLTYLELLEIDEIIFKDRIKIKLNIGTKEKPSYKDIGSLSSGQKCTAILHLLLLDNTDPLIVDQPEDNLDNAFIAENIVQELREQKEKRQFIFSTHNANIPVFGDAEWIGVVEMVDGTSHIVNENVGSIDKETLKPKVEEILEGGKRAFEIRRLKYGF
ncbi:MAG: hypothetical protein Q8M94_07315, partial [Ignavibacteria bacterium]|nr:hypothetical protein [Ignavibacteria bacterium]